MSQAEFLIKQYAVSPAAGKRLIAKAMLRIPSLQDALENRTVVIVAGTTNSYIAEEFLIKLGQSDGFSRSRFFRGVTLPHNYKRPDASSGEENKFLGDVVIKKGVWAKGLTIFDVAEELKAGDVILKGANAVNLEVSQAAVLIGHPTAGTTNPILQCTAGRRVELYLPVGLEKRISGNINDIAVKLNSVNASGSRYMPVSGKIVTELQAIKLLTGADAELIAAGGVCGAEGTYWLAVTGTEEQLQKMDEVYKDTQGESNFVL